MLRELTSLILMMKTRGNKFWRNTWRQISAYQRNHILVLCPIIGQSSSSLARSPCLFTLGINSLLASSIKPFPKTLPKWMNTSNSSLEVWPRLKNHCINSMNKWLQRHCNYRNCLLTYKKLDKHRKEVIHQK